MNKRKSTCQMQNKLETKCFLKTDIVFNPWNICMIVSSKKEQGKCCRRLILTKIVKPETPFGLKITFQEEANEYLVEYKTPHENKLYLKNKLIYEVAYRQENGSWNIIENQFRQLKLLGQQLRQGTRYEVRVRAEPDGDYFEGTWSEWSSSEYVEAAGRSRVETHSHQSSGVVLVIICIVVFVVLVIAISLILIFWKTRIKPLVWPNFPDYKKTLEKLCKKPPKDFDISFNPESFGFAHIHKVDSIQAKEVECFLQSTAPPDPDSSEMVWDGSQHKKSLHKDDKSNLQLPVVYEGMWSSDALNRHTCTSNHATSDAFINMVPDQNSTDGKQLHNGAIGVHSSSSVDFPIQPASGSLCADTSFQIPSTNEIRALNKEEAYVTMSSFYKNCQWKGQGTTRTPHATRYLAPGNTAGALPGWRNALQDSIWATALDTRSGLGPYHHGAPRLQAEQGPHRSPRPQSLVHSGSGMVWCGGLVREACAGYHRVVGRGQGGSHTRAPREGAGAPQGQGKALVHSPSPFTLDSHLG
uniref:Interleukin 7 receptor n=1 Tax=Sphenodon punctatus TaxID=8508 RepID=A0A8D0FZF3_SPHPU